MEDYKEKYEKVVKFIKDLYPFTSDYVKEKIYENFPELLDKDEKIRQTQLNYWRSVGGKEWQGVPVPDVIEWLEKQGEKIDVIKNFNTEFERQISHLLASTINKEHEYNEGFVKWTANALLNYAKHELGKQGESCYPYQPGWRKNYSDNKPKVKHSVLMLTTHGIAEGEWLGGEWCQYRWSCKIKDEDVLYWLYLSDLENLEKENGEQKLVDKCKDCNNVKGCITCIDGDQYAHITEQKPTDKAEPKFKVGDWITIDNPCQIISIDGNYIVQYCDDEKTHEISKKFCESQFHLWTIQDAKDGDVLYSPCCKLLFIFKNDKECYVGYNLNYHAESIVVNSPICIPSDSIPAIKEQCDLLFQKMKEAGYVWDADKKELRKIEQISTDLPNGEDYGIDGLYAAVDILQKTLGNVNGYQTDDGILEHECAISAVKKLYEQKPAWSEEDDYILNLVSKFTSKGYKSHPKIPSLEFVQDWLKSLKERVQSQSN